MRGKKESKWERERRKTPCTRLEIITHVPSKWRFVDLETGDIWRWEKGRYVGCNGKYSEVEKS